MTTPIKYLIYAYNFQSFAHDNNDEYGAHADEKLIVTKGKDFKKEKTKFKNKTAFGGYTISNQVKSISLEDEDFE